MYRLVIVAHGDNEALHGKALDAAVEAVEGVNHDRVYCAYLDRVPGEEPRDATRRQQARPDRY